LRPSPLRPLRSTAPLPLALAGLLSLASGLPACAQVPARPGPTAAATAAAHGGSATADLAEAGRQQRLIEDALRHRDAAGALARARAAAATHPQHAPLQFLLGVAWMDLGRDTEALAQFRHVNQFWPELPDPLNNLAVLHARAGRLEEALLALREALRNDPAHLAARINLGHVHLALAVRAWEDAAALAPLEPAMARRLQAARSLQAPDR
jgi:Flp pilus assembly protein TadD